MVGSLGVAGWRVGWHPGRRRRHSHLGDYRGDRHRARVATAATSAVEAPRSSRPARETRPHHPGTPFNCERDPRPRSRVPAETTTVARRYTGTALDTTWRIEPSELSRDVALVRPVGSVRRLGHGETARFKLTY